MEKLSQILALFFFEMEEAKEYETITPATSRDCCAIILLTMLNEVHDAFFFFDVILLLCSNFVTYIIVS